VYSDSNPTTDIKVDPRKFIEVWQTSNSVAEVASRTRIEKGSCKVRAYRYRQKGVPLKEFPPVVVEETNWEELADYARKLVAEAETSAGDQQE